MFFFFGLIGGVRFKGILFPSMVCSRPTNESHIANILDGYHKCCSLLELQICDDESRICDKCNLPIRGPWGCFAGFQKFGKFSHSEGKFQQNNLPNYYTCMEEHLFRTDFCLRCVLINCRLMINGFVVTDPSIEMPPIMFNIHNVERSDYKDFLFGFYSKLRKHHRRIDYIHQERQLLESIKYGLQLWIEDFNSRKGKYV